MKTKACLPVVTLSLLALLLTGGVLAVAQDNASPEPTVRQAVRFAVSAPVSELAKLPQPVRFWCARGSSSASHTEARLRSRR